MPLCVTLCCDARRLELSDLQCPLRFRLAAILHQRRAPICVKAWLHQHPVVFYILSLGCFRSIFGAQDYLVAVLVDCNLFSCRETL